MKILVFTLHAVILIAAFAFASRFEQSLAGDLEWAICFGVVFLSSFFAYCFTSSPKVILIISALSPLSTLGMFMLVNVMFSVGISAVGVGLAVLCLKLFHSVKTK